MTFARIEMCHCHVLKLSIFTLCLPFYYKNLAYAEGEIDPFTYFFVFILFSLWSWEFWIQNPYYSSIDIWVSKNIDKIDQVQLIHIDILCLLTVMKADRVHYSQHCSSFGNALAHLFMCTASIKDVELWLL